MKSERDRESPRVLGEHVTAHVVRSFEMKRENERSSECSIKETVRLSCIGDTCDRKERKKENEKRKEKPGPRERDPSTGKRSRDDEIIRDQATVDYNGNEAVTVNYKSDKKQAGPVN